MFFRLLAAAVGAHVALSWVRALRRGAQARQTAAAGIPAYSPLPVSILVPAWNEHGTVEQCIRALQGLTYPHWEALILAGGADGTYQAVVAATAGDERFRVFERRPGPKNEALMRGVRQARHDILVFLDADCNVDPGWLTALIAPFASGADATLGHRLPKQDTWVTQAELMENMQVYEILGSASIQGDRSLAIRRETFEQTGELPSATYAREDWDLAVRMAENGAEAVFAKGAYLHADRPSTLAEFWANEVRWRRTHLAGLWEHRDHFLQRPLWAAAQAYFYGLSAALTVTAAAAVGTAAIWPATRPVAAKTALLAALWIVGRRAALGGEIAAYTGDRIWLLRAWGPVALMLLSFPAAVMALLSARRWRSIPFYKGPRAT
ncbi:MAG: glycosyltransferase [Chloroflexi bacterium]|nr:glycosyltransferase [Chloroflexota bacterium]